MRKSAALALLVATTMLTANATAWAHDDRWWARDKASHFSVNLVLAVHGYELGAAFATDRRVRVATGAGICLAASFAKEWSDRRGGGNASARDMTWNAFGAATGLLFAWAVDRFLLR